MIKQKVSWSEIREEVARVNQRLADVLDQLAPDLPLELGIFNYGEEIFPLENRQPFLVLNKSCEIFSEYGDRLMSQALIGAGEFFCIDSFFNQNITPHTKLCKITAGARNVFMLPKVADQVRHRKMQDAFNFELKKSENPQDHWRVFKYLANSSKIKDKWECRVLFFDPKIWGQYRNDPAWQGFYNILLQQLQDESEFQRQQGVLEMLIGITQKQRQHLRFFLPEVEQMKQLFMLGMKGTPGFKVAESDETLPLQLIQSAYLEHYGMKEYPPLILTSAYFDWRKDTETPIYYSFNHPNSYYCSPAVNDLKTNAEELEHFIWGFKKVVNLILTQDIIDENSPFYQFLQSCEFNFYHPKTENNKDFISPTMAPSHNPLLMKGWEKHFQFPVHSTFWKGCVGIRRAC